jgi:hypothetical protein
MFTDEVMMTAQVFPLNALGRAFKPAPAPVRAEVPGHDRR